ncbi:hypothetical protein FD33_GL000564 [Companilactobacillus paralimentarius DSM 13238 = JCM 10415]|uniref:Uncharacterized protein n=2 Tax=Companilactobacillus paralimentarius TaxID=83526 RepID=A0A0R1PJ08_9LACO|nr:hypothetical protein FD33_GL000564 [Companilactobacillus paralimentarius DSM 13238 = JCM 10415]
MKDMSELVKERIKASSDSKLVEREITKQIWEDYKAEYKTRMDDRYNKKDN